MSSENSNPPEETGLKLQENSGLVRLPSSGTPVLSEIINRSIIHIHTSKALGLRHRIGGHELCSPDYQLVCAWAEELQLTPENVMITLLSQSDEMEAELKEHYQLNALTDNEGRRTRIVDGHFKSLLVVRALLPISGIPLIEGLIVERFTLLGGEKSYRLRLPDEAICLDLSLLNELVIFDCRGVKLSKLNISATPKLSGLVCGLNDLISVDLSRTPNLKLLFCYGNGLIDLDLSKVTGLAMLGCWDNHLTSLDLSKVPNLKYLNCNENQLTSLDLSAASNLTRLSCLRNHITNLDLSNVPNLGDLNCDDNRLTALDLSAVPNLTKLSCDDNHITNLDLGAVPELTEIWCDRNQLSELDVRGLMKLQFVICLNEKTRIIQRPDQRIG